MEPISLSERVIELGQKCAVWITGFPEDGDEVITVEVALAAIEECIRLGIERNNELNELRQSLRVHP